MEDLEAKRIFFDAFKEESEAEAMYYSYSKIKKWYLENWKPVSIEEINRLIDQYYPDSPEDLRKELEFMTVSIPLLKLMKKLLFFSFNRYFYQRFKKENSKKRIANVRKIINEFIERNPPNLNGVLMSEEEYLAHIKSLILCDFAEIYVAESPVKKTMEIEDLIELRKFKKNMDVESKKFHRLFKNYVKQYSIITSQIENIYKNQYIDYELKSSEELNLLNNTHNKLVDEIQKAKKLIDDSIDGYRYLYKKISSRWISTSKIVLKALHSKLTEHCRTTSIGVSRFMVRMMIELGIYLEEEFKNKKSALLSERFPEVNDKKILKDKKKVGEFYADVLKRKDVDEIYSGIEDEIVEQLSLNLEKIFLRSK